MTGYGRMGSPGCCCLEGCTIYGDAFASDTIGVNWTEVAGDWTISAGLLSIAATGGILIADQTHPDGDRVPQVVSIDIRLAAADDLARVIIVYDDSDNYLFAEFSIDSNGCGSVTLYERIGGTDTELGSFAVPFDTPLDTWLTLTLCYVPGASSFDPGSLTIKAESATHEIWTRTVATSADLPGDQAGVGSGSTAAGSIEFDNFDYQYYYDPETHPNCPMCGSDTNCELHSDNFNRASLGCTWEQVAGTWSIDTNQLTIDEEDAILRNRTPHPDNIAFVQMAFKFRCEADVVILAILDYTDDSNFFFVKLEPGSHGDCGRVSFWRKTAGVDAQLGNESLLLGMSADTGQTHTIVICWKDDFVRVTLTPDTATDYGSSSHSVALVDQVAAEPYVGLGTGTGGGTNQVWFDDFTLSKVLQVGVDGTETCPPCTPQNCVLYFNNPREDAASFPTTFNCLWTIIVGGWTINSLTSSNAETLFSIATTGGTAFNELIEIDDDNAMLVNETGHPLTTGEGFLDLTSGAEVQVVSFNYGDIVRLLLGWQDDENYLYGEWEWAADDESTGFLRVGKVVAGVETELAEQASSVLAGQPQGDHDGSVVDQLPSILRVCYDGLELRANFTNLADVAFSSGNRTSVSGTAGVGWNPGKSGLATVTIAASVYFAGFRYFHDIYGGDPNCAPCVTSAVCGWCKVTEDSVEVDKTPPIVLVQMQGMAPNTVTGCDDANQFNDTFALPFYEHQTTGINACHWKIFPRFCAGGPTPLYSSITFTFHALSGFDISTATFTMRVQIQAYDPDNGTSPYGSTSAGWLLGSNIAAASIPTYEDEIGFDCAAYLASWITLADGPYPNYSYPGFSGSSWLIPGGTSDPSTARVKVLA